MRWGNEYAVRILYYTARHLGLLLMVTLRVNKAVSKIRREPLIRDLRVLCRTRTYERNSSRLIQVACTAIILVCPVKTVCVSVFYMWKTFVPKCIKGNISGKYPAFPRLFVWIENPVKYEAWVNQKIVTTWFSGNARGFLWNCSLELHEIWQNNSSEHA